MSKEVTFKIDDLSSMQVYPKKLFYKGNLDLLKKRKVSIVGTRHPNSYSKKLTFKIAQELAKRNVAIVSGAAIGVDTLAHKGAEPKNTIAVVANGLDIKYPRINANMIKSIENEGLILSAYEDGFEARNYTFVQRNEIVVSLGEVLIVIQADEKSGTLTSVEYALKMGKKVYTIPHQLDDSKGTQKFLERGLIEPIYNLKEFFDEFGELTKNEQNHEVYLSTNPLYDDALKKLGSKLYELELEGRFSVENGYIKPN
ncbi:MAG: DNA-processing protein DprA [Halarcobacter sp.]